MRSCGVIVTYNRKKMLIQNLEACLNQEKKLDKLYIIDNNSTDGTKEYLNENNYLKRDDVEYIKLSENIGGAGGFYFGVKRGYEDGYDYIVLMDDDGRPYDKKCFKELISFADKNYELNTKMMINSLVICDNKKLSFGLGKITFISQIGNLKTIDTINPFNGTLLTKELIKEIGFPNRDLFIKGDEVDYRIRAVHSNATVCTVVDSLYYHPQLPSIYKKFLFKQVKITDEAPWKEYYRARNHTYINLKYKKYRKLFHHYLWQFRNILLSSNKCEKIKYFFKGIYDGIYKKMGKTVKP